jgi:hypothetical protein
MSSRDRKPLLTRRQLVQFLRDNDFPISNGTLDQLCAPACGGGPPLAGVWGGRGFYDPAQALAWARRRFAEMELRRNRQQRTHDRR